MFLWDLEVIVSDILDRLEKVEKAIAELSKSATKKVEWQEQTTESGIQLSGSTTVRRTGDVIGVTVLPTDLGKITVLFVVKRDGDNAISVMDAGFIKFV